MESDWQEVRLFLSFAPPIPQAFDTMDLDVSVVPRISDYRRSYPHACPTASRPLIHLAPNHLSIASPNSHSTRTLTADQVARVPLPRPNPHAAATAVTCCDFDTAQELMWAGNEYGRVASFYGPELQKYTSYRAHEGHVKTIVPTDRGILSVGARSVHLAERRGRALWHLTHADFRDLRCVCPLSKASEEVLVAGCQSSMFLVNVEKGQITQQMPSQEHYTLMKRGGQYICAATSTGSVQIIDPKSFTVLKTWKAHMGWVNDMDANSNFLVTCGNSHRQHFGSVADPLAKVFDLKTLMPLPPVAFHAGASFVRMHPRMLTTSIIASKNGQLQVVDIVNSSMINVRQVSLIDAYLTCLEVAPSGEAMALTDSLCCLQVWGSPSRMHFSDYSVPTEFADSEPVTKTSMDWSGNQPLSTVGMPYYRDILLSAWPNHMMFDVGAPPVKLDPQVTAALTRTEVGAWAPNPRKTKRNQALDTRAVRNASGGIEGPKFLSEQAKDGDNEGRRMSEVLESLAAMNADGSLKVDVPVMYRNVEIRYSRFGIEDFDFE